MTNIVIASAARTAVGSFGGSFSNISAHDLGSAVLEEVVQRSGIDKSEVSETIMGQYWLLDKDRIQRVKHILMRATN